MNETTEPSPLLAVRSNDGLADDLATLNWKCISDHYKALFERHKEDSTFYQAQLFHAWRSLAQQQKGLRRQAKKIKRLQQRIAELTANAELTGPASQGPG